MMEDDRDMTKFLKDRLERIIFAKWVFEPEYAKFRRRTLIGYGSVVFAILILIIYAMINLADNRIPLTLLNLAAAVAFACVLVYFRMTKGPDNYVIEKADKEKSG